MSYTFRIVFSGLCFHHLPPRPSGNGTTPSSQAGNGFDPAVLLVNATEPRMSIDRRTHLHRHLPTLTFDPAQLDDYSVDVGSFETDFRLIPTGGGPQQGKTRFQDSLALLDLVGQEVWLELEPGDQKTRGLSLERKLASPPEVPGNGQEHDLHWIPALPEVDRRIDGLKKQCFESVADNTLVASRVRLTQGTLKVVRVGRTSPGDDPLRWDFFPNAHPGRSDGKGGWVPVRQALADQVVLELQLVHPVRLRYRGARNGSLTFFGTGEEESDREVTVHVANLPSMVDLPDTDVITHFRWFYELFDWKNGLPSDLPAPRPATRGLTTAAGGNTLCPHGGG